MSGTVRGVRGRRSASEAGTLRRGRMGPGELRNGSYRPRGTSGGGRRLTVMLLLLGALAVAAYLLLPSIFGGVARSLAEENADWLRVPFVADAVRDQIAERIEQPAGTDATPVEFVVTPGSSARDITEQLYERGLIGDRLAFSYILITEDLGRKLQAGVHTLDQTMTPREVAEALQQTTAGPSNRVTVALRQGLRLEQVTAYLVNEEWPTFDPAEFYRLAQQPPAELRGDYEMLATLPDGRNLEGYLGFGVFEVEADIDAESFLRVLLERRQTELTGLLEREPPEPLENFYQVLTLASIVEAETDVPEERPTVAGVYLNRLDPSQWPTRLLNADPTVVYGYDTLQLREMPVAEWDGYSFWGPTGTPMADVQLEGGLAGYQTYRQRGLPPGPIRSPSVPSIMGVLEPDTSDGYLYLVSKNDGTGTHAFAKTFEEHMENINRYLRGHDGEGEDAEGGDAEGGDAEGGAEDE